MSLMELFSSGNPGNPNKKTGVTATDHATQGGNPGNPGNPEKTIIETQIELIELPEQPPPCSLVVTCYTPKGNPIEAEARDEEHAAWLKRMNTSPKVNP